MVKVKFTLEQAMNARRGSRGVVLLFFNLGGRWGWVFNTTPQLFHPRKDPVPIAQEAGWASGPVWKGAENLAPTGIQSRDLPVYRMLQEEIGKKS
jgi:hypothetical protein